MNVKRIAECSKHSAILSTCIKLPSVFKNFLPIFEWLPKAEFTVCLFKMLAAVAGVLFKDFRLLKYCHPVKIWAVGCIFHLRANLMVEL